MQHKFAKTFIAQKMIKLNLPAIKIEFEKLRRIFRGHNQFNIHHFTTSSGIFIF